MKLRLSSLSFKTGAPEWITNCADMMSLVLTFFILLFSVTKLKDTGGIYDVIHAFQGPSIGSSRIQAIVSPDVDAAVEDLEDSGAEEPDLEEHGVP